MKQLEAALISKNVGQQKHIKYICGFKLRSVELGEFSMKRLQQSYRTNVLIHLCYNRDVRSAHSQIYVGKSTKENTLIPTSLPPCLNC